MRVDSPELFQNPFCVDWCVEFIEVGAVQVGLLQQSPWDVLVVQTKIKLMQMERNSCFLNMFEDETTQSTNTTLDMGGEVQR